jgi:hypothetical protein
MSNYITIAPPKLPIGPLVQSLDRRKADQVEGGI